MNRVLAAALLLAGLACSTDPSTSVSLSGTAERSCGPTDGPAVAMELRGDTNATLKIIVNGSRSVLPARPWRISQTGLEASASLCPDAGICEGALQGQVTFERVGTELRGQVALAFPGIAISGPFSAFWREVNILCG